MKSNLTILVVALALVASGCDTDDKSEAMDDISSQDMDQAESATFLVTVENVSTVYTYLKSGVFNTPVGADAPGPLLPGHTYQFEFTAGPGMYLSFATMFVPSNDLFYAPAQGGIALYDDDGMPISGDVTDQVMLWDAGTEANEEPGAGENQPLNQSGPDTGMMEANEIQTAMNAEDGFMYPETSQVVKVMLEAGEAHSFVLRIENVSDEMTLNPSMGDQMAVPLAPGVFVVHKDFGPLFEPGSADYGFGLEQLAEDGDPGPLAAYLASMSGVTSPLAPGVFAVSQGDNPLYAAGQADAGKGLEALAEDGDPSGLATSLEMMTEMVSESGAFAIPEGAEMPAPAFPGQAYAFEFDAMEGDRLSLVTMLVQSNDLFFGNGDGIELFDAEGMAIQGDITAHFGLWDAGTEVNEEPGVGSSQAPRQSGADTGADEMGVVQQVQDDFTYHPVEQVIKVSITVL